MVPGKLGRLVTLGELKSRGELLGAGQGVSAVLHGSYQHDVTESRVGKRWVVWTSSSTQGVGDRERESPGRAPGGRRGFPSVGTRIRRQGWTKCRGRGHRGLAKALMVSRKDRQTRFWSVKGVGGRGEAGGVWESLWKKGEEADRGPKGHGAALMVGVGGGTYGHHTVPTALRSC